jgi:hypothetical protein
MDNTLSFFLNNYLSLFLIATNFLSSSFLFSQDHHAVEVSGLVWRRFEFFFFWVLAGSGRKWPHSVMIVKGFLVPDFGAGCVWRM